MRTGAQREEAVAYPPSIDGARWTGICAAVTFALVKTNQQGFGIAVLLLIPFYIFCVPTIAWFQNRGVWLWSKQDNDFYLVDPADSPTLANVAVVLNMVCTPVFTVLFFMVQANFGFCFG